ncbi:hypothetical protein KKB54_00540 [bacterium]|nr:hypothetical protein [bacterium]MBU1152669.1 hypothetical protein [bacterium]
MKNEETYELINYLRRKVSQKVSLSEISEGLIWPKDKVLVYLEELKKISLVKRDLEKGEDLYYLYSSKKLDLWLTLAAQHEWRGYLKEREGLISETIDHLVEELRKVLMNDLFFIIYYGEDKVGESIKDGIIKLFTIIKNNKDNFMIIEKVLASTYLKYGVRVRSINSDLNSFGKLILSQDNSVDNIGKAVFRDGKIIYGYDKCWDFIKKMLTFS